MNGRVRVPPHGEPEESSLTDGGPATGIAANWYAVHALRRSGFAEQPGLRRLAAFALLVFGAAPYPRGRLSR